MALSALLLPTKSLKLQDGMENLERVSKEFGINHPEHQPKEQTLL